jgi:tripartite-type tricarboxylate transporter receptor subunit TctC
MKKNRLYFKLTGIFITLLLVLALVGCSNQQTQKQDKPEEIVFPEKGKSIRMIITHGVGGSVDTAARGMAPFLEKYLGVPVVTENMEGAGGRRAMEYVFAAPPDGYTIVVSAFPSRLIGELLYPESKYKMKEFVHLGSWLGGDYRSIIVSKDSPYQTFEELMEASKSKQLKAAGGGGLGSTSQLQTVFLKEKVKLNADFIPFESTAEVANAVLGKHVDFGVMPLSSALRFEAQGDVRIIAVHAPKRSSAAPHVPTLEELGYKGVVIPYGVGAWAPPGTPEEIQKKYAEAIAKAVKDPDFLAWAEKTKVLLEPMGPEEFLQTTLNDYENISSVLHLLKEAK